MKYSPIDDSKNFPCPDCNARPFFECIPRDPGDANWVHTARRMTMEMNVRVALAQR